MQIAIDSATPLDDAGPSANYDATEAAYGGYGPMRSYGRFYGSMDFDDVSTFAYICSIDEKLFTFEQCGMCFNKCLMGSIYSGEATQEEVQVEVAGLLEWT